MDRKSKKKVRKVAGSVVKAILLLLMLFITVYPILWMVFGSLKDTREFYNNIWGLPKAFRLENYAYAWSKASMFKAYINTIINTAGFLVILLPCVACAAYAVARMEFKGKKIIFNYLLIGIMIPAGVLALPSYIMGVKLGLTNTHIGLILFYVGQNTAFGIFLMRSFFISLPASLEEAAMIDGCTRFQSFLKIILPLSKPGIVVQIVYSGLNVWNEYMLANLFVRNGNLKTIPLSIKIFVGQYTTDYPSLFAALVIAILPIVVAYILGQRTFIEGMTAGAVKG